MLNDYLQQAQRLLGFDLDEQEFNLDDLIAFVNMARRHVAAQGQCVRWLTPIGAPVESIKVLAAGSGYVDPTIAITRPDFPSGQLPSPQGAQALANAQQIGGQISNASVLYGGEGYFHATATVLDPVGAGAELAVTVAPSANRTHIGQEVYSFEDIDLGPNFGAQAIIAIKNIVIYWGSLSYTLRLRTVANYIEDIRHYGTTYLGIPAYWCQYNFGEVGTIRIYPLPDQEYPMQWDCLIIPQDLDDDGSPEPIPALWREAIPIYAVYLALLGKSVAKPSLTPLIDRFYNPKDGGLFGDLMRKARAAAQPVQTWKVNW